MTPNRIFLVLFLCDCCTDKFVSSEDDEMDPSAINKPQKEVSPYLKNYKILPTQWSNLNSSPQLNRNTSEQVHRQLNRNNF